MQSHAEFQSVWGWLALRWKVTTTQSPDSAGLLERTPPGQTRTQEGAEGDTAGAWGGELGMVGPRMQAARERPGPAARSHGPDSAPRQAPWASLLEVTISERLEEQATVTMGPANAPMSTREHTAWQLPGPRGGRGLCEGTSVPDTGWDSHSESQCQERAR